MRRDVMYSASKNIMNALSASNIYKVIFNNRLASKDGRGLNSESLKSLNSYSLLAAKYGDAEKEICKFMNIGELNNPATWHQLIEIKSPEDEKYVIKTLQNIRFAQIHLPKLLKLIQQNFVEGLKQGSDNLPSYFKDKALLSITVVEQEGYLSSPKRLSKVLDCIDAFYTVIAAIHQQASDDLMVLAIDSGHDKFVDFLGVEKIINGIKDLIISIWDRKVFHRNNQAGADIHFIVGALPVIEEIKRLKDEGELEADLAENLIDDVAKAATQFIESGVIIPEINAQASHDPRELMKPEARLLVSQTQIIDQKITIDSNIDSEETDFNEKDEVSEQSGELEELGEDELAKRSQLLGFDSPSDLVRG